MERSHLTTLSAAKSGDALCRGIVFNRAYERSECGCATHPSDHIWRCVRAWSLEEKDEPRAS